MLLHPGTIPFNVVYVLAGVTDMLDGPLARRSGAATETGAQLDSLCDMIFLLCAGGKLLPLFPMTMGLWAVTGVTALWKVGNLVYAKRRLGQAKSLHTTLNRLTGLLLFMLPLIWAYGCFEPAAWIAAGLALLSAGEESLQLKKMAHSKA